MIRSLCTLILALSVSSAADAQGLVAASSASRAVYDTASGYLHWQLRSGKSWETIVQNERFILHNRDTAYDMATARRISARTTNGHLEIEQEAGSFRVLTTIFTAGDSAHPVCVMVVKISGGATEKELHSEGYAERMQLGAATFADDFPEGVVHIHRKKIRAVAIFNLGRYHYEDHYFNEYTRHRDNAGDLWLAKILCYASGPEPYERAVEQARAFVAGRTPWQLLPQH